MAKATPQLDPSENPALTEEDAEALAAAQALENRGVAPLTQARRVKIMLEESDDIPPTGLFLAINGRAYVIRPGEEVDVPEEVVHCLNDAVMSTPRVDNTNNIIDYRNKLRFPYRVIAG